MSRGDDAVGPILIAEEDSDQRSALTATLELAGFAIRHASSGEEALEAASHETPCVVLLEVALQGICGYEVCHELRRRFGDGLPIIFVSGARQESFDRVAGLLIGADDYLLKPYAPDEVLVRLRRLIRRARPVASAVAAKLTKRELEVLRLLADGLEQNEIASRLYISRKTVGTHIENMMRKLGVRSRAQAVALAYREQLLDGGA
jgi:DNA-binding NarL/FixJ family response regulator